MWKSIIELGIRIPIFFHSILLFLRERRKERNNSYELLSNCLLCEDDYFK